MRCCSGIGAVRRPLPSRPLSMRRRKSGSSGSIPSVTNCSPVLPTLPTVSSPSGTEPLSLPPLSRRPLPRRTNRFRTITSAALSCAIGSWCSSTSSWFTGIDYSYEV
uniref:Uncharacterized protein n=1 Tax=Cacopsylla melanoneura TaxID=428564 RepID=A0A8D8LXE8_9HEMI